MKYKFILYLLVYEVICPVDIISSLEMLQITSFAFTDCLF